MSLHDYLISQQVSSLAAPFDALLYAALRKADSTNAELLRRAFPVQCAEFEARYHAPRGRLATDPPGGGYPVPGDADVDDDGAADGGEVR